MICYTVGKGWNRHSATCQHTQHDIDITSYHAALGEHKTERDLDLALDACADCARAMGAYPDQVIMALAHYRALVKQWAGHKKIASRI